MIPKTIHYCWFGRNPLPESAQHCIQSWRKKCSDYAIREWNEDTFDLTQCPLYVQQAYMAGKWAFVTDYVRLCVVYQHGGIYLDTDVEVKKKFDSLLIYSAFFGFEDGKHIATGLGFGAVKGCKILSEMMQDYLKIPFIKSDGNFDMTPCPKRNTQALLRHGLVQNDTIQVLDDEILILPTIYLCPINFRTGKRTYSRKTISIHHFSSSWYTQEQRQQHGQSVQELKRQRKAEQKQRLQSKCKKILKIVIGEKAYNVGKNWYLKQKK